MIHSYRFSKLHGLGNDFVLIDDPGAVVTPKAAVQLCNRHFGIGADQLLWIKKPKDEEADARMEIFNADGSVAEMCGNGIRAAALHLSKRARKPVYRIETVVGIKEVESRRRNVYSVDMGKPELGSKKGEVLKLKSGDEVLFFEVDVGNPHAVFFPEKALAAKFLAVGPEIETHPRFPNRTNVEFVRVVSNQSIHLRVWERGAGATLACGTGACAAAVVAIHTGKVESPVEVYLPGGMLKITWASGSPILMEGPATFVFDGEIEIEL